MKHPLDTRTADLFGDDLPEEGRWSWSEDEWLRIVAIARAAPRWPFYSAFALVSYASLAESHLRPNTSAVFYPAIFA